MTIVALCSIQLNSLSATKLSAHVRKWRAEDLQSCAEKDKIIQGKFTQKADFKMAGTRNGYIFPPPKSFMQNRGQQATGMGQSLQAPNGPNFCTQTFANSPMRNIHRIGFNDNFSTPPQFRNYGNPSAIPPWPNNVNNNNQFHNFYGRPPPPPPPQEFEPPHMLSRWPRPRNHFMNGGQWRQEFNGNNDKKQNDSRSYMRGCHGTAANDANKISENSHNCQEEKMLYFCEPCEKGFKTENDKGAHLKGHVECEVDGCNFVASRKALKLHFIQNHEEGMFKIVLKNDEDIKRWKEERKNNYPRISRQTDLIDKQNRRNEDGNVLNTKEFRYQGRGGWHERTYRNKFQHGNENQRSSWQPEERNNNNVQQNKFTKQERNEESKQSPSKKINHGYIDCSSVGSKENEANKIQTNDMELSSSVKTNALASLTLCYQSSSDSEDEDNDGNNNDSNDKKSVESNISKEAPLERKGRTNTGQNDVKFERVTTECCVNSTASSVIMDSRVVPEAMNRRIKGSGTESSNIVNENYMNCNRNLKDNGNRIQNNNTRKREGMSHNWKELNSQRKKQRQSKPTLLEMLLANDIRHERNIMLQSIRHIIRNKFFIKAN
eukprot:Seg1517.8 transcript_id=Seg1517.8/GoldUCD/mRNA.D3Y31 product="Nuclear fragile X mental retardation-interacting protein 1" protein_id=Seg1517.8/GoldUCD/D3Y31